MGKLLAAAEQARQKINSLSSRKSRAEIGQFLTPAPVAHFMASLFQKQVEHVRILDPGAGAGALFAALVQTLCNRKNPPLSIEVVAYENDECALTLLSETMEFCRDFCSEAGVNFHGQIHDEDFISIALHQTEEHLLVAEKPGFTHAILNPPYKKLNQVSKTAKRLKAAKIEASNLYAAFVWLSMRMLKPGGELTAITPRSFCNGPYFRKFRKKFLADMSLRRIHSFESRKEAFSGDAVLQENIIFHSIRSAPPAKSVVVSSTHGPEFTTVKAKSIPYARIVLRNDPDQFIHLAQSKKDLRVMEKMSHLTHTLKDLKLNVSTGKVVGFRVRDFLSDRHVENTVPLIYPCHLYNGAVKWPKDDNKKPHAIVHCRGTVELLIPSGYYVLLKRFSSKEEKRRIVAGVLSPDDLGSDLVGLENHLNYFHIDGKGLPREIAKGLSLFLNSSFFDSCFRLFSGHTQVNATDLRKMHYPSYNTILRLSSHAKELLPAQADIDHFVEKELGFNG